MPLSNGSMVIHGDGHGSFTGLLRRRQGGVLHARSSNIVPKRVHPTPPRLGARQVKAKGARKITSDQFALAVDAVAAKKAGAHDACTLAPRTRPGFSSPAGSGR